LCYVVLLDLLSYSTEDPAPSVICWAHFFRLACNYPCCQCWLFTIYLRRTPPQSIIEEEGGLSGKGNNGADSARQSEDNANMAGGDASARSERSADTGDQSNWDQPLIVAEPDVKVRQSALSCAF
jgi:hypothetical protein